MISSKIYFICFKLDINAIWQTVKDNNTSGTMELPSPVLNEASSAPVDLNPSSSDKYYL